MKHCGNQIKIAGVTFNDCRDLEWEPNDDGTIRLSFSAYFSGADGYAGKYSVTFPRLEISEPIALRSNENGELWNIVRIDE